MKNILFMGTPQFAVPILEALIASDYHVIGVVTQPDRPVGRKKILTASPVKQVALFHDIPVYQPEKLAQSSELATLMKLPIDLIVTAAYGQFLPETLLHYPTYRSINVHGSLLPKYRGGAPIQYALLNLEEETGVTIMYMEKKMDAGAIIRQRAIPILPKDTVATLFDKLSLIGRDLLIEVLPALFNGEIDPIEQDETKVLYSPALTKEEEEINWYLTAKQINGQVRAMNSWPGAYTWLNGERFKIWQATPVDAYQADGLPGEIIQLTKESLWVLSGSGTVLSLEEVQPFGKKKMTIAEFCRGVGTRLSEGDCFGE